MKKIFLLLAIAMISFQGVAQIGTNPIYVPSTVIYTPQTEEPQVVQNYISGWLDIIIKDANYYKRQDQIAQAEFDGNVEMIKKAMDYYDKKDWASAVYYGQRIKYTEYIEINNIKHFLVTTSYFYLDNVKESKRWYAISSRKVDPETMRAIDSSIKKSGMNNKIIQADSELAEKKKISKHNRNKAALIGGISASVTSIIIVIASVLPHFR